MSYRRGRCLITSILTQYFPLCPMTWSVKIRLCLCSCQTATSKVSMLDTGRQGNRATSPANPVRVVSKLVMHSWSKIPWDWSACFYNSSFMFLNQKRIRNTHFAKRPSDLEQNGTQEKTQFSGTVFHTLSHGVLRFVASVGFKNHW